MNTQHPGPGNDSFEREWELQERALREERAGLADSGDPELAPYRRVAHALRRAPEERLPSNFAYLVAGLAAQGLRAAKLDTRLEQGIVRVLVAAMVLGAVAVALLFGRDWLAALDAYGAGASAWLATAVACVGLTWAMEGVRRWRLPRQP